MKIKDTVFVFTYWFPTYPSLGFNVNSTFSQRILLQNIIFTVFYWTKFSVVLNRPMNEDKCQVYEYCSFRQRS